MLCISIKVLEECFDFKAIKSLFARTDFSFCYDALNGVQGTRFTCFTSTKSQILTQKAHAGHVGQSLG